MARFKTRARAVDMLGRQQIAGVPNAISELFKNAHDAYAEHVEVDYFRSDGLFVLRDDGLGMTKDDFEDRWLTIGTESKLASVKGIKPPPVDPTKKRRPITGEKGIGRLAIAVIGPQVLVLTRAKRDDKLHDLVAAFLHWGLFEAPGVNLEQIEIPVLTFPGGTLPSNKDIQGMVKTVRQNVVGLVKEDYIDRDFAERIIQDLKRFDFDLPDMADFLDTPTLLGNGHGTHFYILPTTENLVAELDIDLKEKETSKLRKLLLGFSNTMVPDSPPPPISTAFRYWPNDEQKYDIIGEREFFTPEEFELADHHIQGRFDEFGQFVGAVSVYGEKTFNHVVPWPKGASKPVLCGPFQINVAYVQGLARDSKIPPQEWARLNRKLNQIGGLYIYQDNIRILPYGDFDVDFLGIEKRRSSGIGYYFFSYRLMIGAIELNRQDNGKLVEKAGREGFQENKAYREFREILINFFIQLAADFFRSGGQYSDTWQETRDELNRLDQARKKQEKESRKKRREFETRLDSFFQQANSEKPQEEVNTVLNNLKKRIEDAAKRRDEITLLDAEVAANRELTALRNKHKVDRPQGIGLSRQLKHDWNAYAVEVERLEKDIFFPTQTEIDKIITEASQRLKFALNQKQRIELLVNEIVVDARKSTQMEIRATRDIFGGLRDRFEELARQTEADLRNTAAAIEAELTELDLSDKNREQVEVYRRKWERRVNDEAGKFQEILVHIRTQLESINWYRDENDYLIGNAEITAALEDEVLALRERADADLELTQLGMALDIINHEFSNTIRAIRNNLRHLKAWADANPELLPIYHNITDSFTHLDGYLTLFTPLNRRLYRSADEIIGSNIATYLKDLFKERMERHEVKLTTTSAFREMSIVGYPSSFYPVFINLVDNAIFWLKDQQTPRKIKLDAKGDNFIVSDNGPGVPNRDRDAIFELGFTRKPGGRGMGLYISREVLKNEGYQLQLADNSDTGAVFIIRPIDS
jgi:signal transduction histidine kinase